MPTRAQKRSRSPDSTLTSLPDIDRRRLPRGWIERKSKLTGELFYEDRVTGNLTFEYPKESPVSDVRRIKQELKQRSLSDVRNDLNKMIFSNRKYVAEEEKLLAKKEQATSGAALEVAKPEEKVARPKNSDADALLGWEMAVSQTTGQSYYKNLATGEGRLTFPHVPTGWSRAFSKTRKKYYYFCGKTLNSVYSYPIKGENTELTESALLMSLSTDAPPVVAKSLDIDTREASPARSLKSASGTKPTNDGGNRSSADDDDDKWPDED
eukprot:GEMP01040315.1.p1 GENE.GEMP01040315.1~~GEMP01040315.1.p1  ORF type:complete len:267 (+),score=44.99 GEMP01040315.1:158-958(+)